ncbi:MAG: adenosylcobinamide amidohydrolase [Pseudomonadota bacterium]
MTDAQNSEWAAQRLSLDRPWLTLDLGQPMRVLSWSINRPGIVTAQRIVWREVRNADLPQNLDVHDWLLTELANRGEHQSVAFLTSRNITHFCTDEVNLEHVCARAVATVGLSNAERVGSRQPSISSKLGTINVAAWIETGLSEAGLIEAMSVVVQARTTAVLDANIPLLDKQTRSRATGTGTDCVAVAAPVGSTSYAGLHTAIGEALGRVVYDAVLTGAQDWKTEQERNTHA